MIPQLLGPTFALITAVVLSVCNRNVGAIRHQNAFPTQYVSYVRSASKSSHELCYSLVMSQRQHNSYVWNSTFQSIVFTIANLRSHMYSFANFREKPKKALQLRPAYSVVGNYNVIPT